MSCLLFVRSFILLSDVCNCFTTKHVMFVRELCFYVDGKNIVNLCHLRVKKRLFGNVFMILQRERERESLKGKCVA